MESEFKTNAKRLGQKEQYQIRKSIIQLCKAGKSKKEIAAILGVSLRHVQQTLKSYNDGGISAIKPGKRGRRYGEKRTLTPEQEQEMQLIVVEKTPEQLKLKEWMWSRNNIHELIKQLYKIEMPLSSLGYYLARWGFSTEHPMRRANKHNAVKIKNWVKNEIIDISKKAKKEQAEIFFGSEKGLQNSIIKTEAQGDKVNIFSAISNRGKLRFVLYKENMNTDKIIDFLHRLVRDSTKKVFLILNNQYVFHVKKAIEWLKKHREAIEVFYLPY